MLRCEEDAFPRADGSTEWIQWEIRPWHTAEGDIGGITMMTQVVTEQKRAREDLRDSEARFRALADLSLAGIYIIQDDRFVYTNPAMERIYGAEAGALIGTDSMARIHPDDRVTVAEHMRRRKDHEAETVQYETRALTVDGRQIWLEILGSSMMHEGRPALFGNALDITARVRAEEETRASEERFRQIAETIDDVICLRDAETGKFLYVSPAYERIWGLPCAVLLESPRAWREAIHPDDRERVAQEIVTRGSNDYEAEYRIVRPDGAVRLVSAWSFKIRNAEGKIVRFAAVVKDITEQRDLEHQLRQSQKMEAIGVLAGGIAHDFNNMLTVILNYADMLMREPKSLERARSAVRQIKTAAERAAQLTRQLLAFSRQQVLQPRVLDLRGVVAGTEKMLRRLIGEDVDLVTFPSESPALAFVDPGQFEQVLMNLAVNGRDAMPDGGQLSIAISSESLNEVEARRHGLQPGPFVKLSVADTGVGMDSTTQSRIFEPFFTTKPPGKGTGLGLSTVFGIVQQSAGRIEVKSEPGHGTTFDVWLPSAQEAPTEGTIRPPDMRRSGTETILVVEDEETVRNLIQLILEEQGYQVLEARNGTDALILGAEHPGEIHLVLTDVVMPQMSGDQMVAKLRVLRPDIRVLYMSGYPDRTTARERVSGTEAFIKKPFTPDTLLAQIAETLATLAES